MEYYTEIPEEWHNKTTEELEKIRDTLYNKYEAIENSGSESVKDYLVEHIYLIESYIDSRYIKEDNLKHKNKNLFM